MCEREANLNDKHWNLPEQTIHWIPRNRRIEFWTYRKKTSSDDTQSKYISNGVAAHDEEGLFVWFVDWVLWIVMMFWKQYFWRLVIADVIDCCWKNISWRSWLSMESIAENGGNDEWWLPIEMELTLRVDCFLVDTTCIRKEYLRFESALNKPTLVARMPSPISMCSSRARVVD